jgi:hypothetical protein
MAATLQTRAASLFMATAIYFNPAHAAGFATDRKILNALQRLKKTNKKKQIWCQDTRQCSSLATMSGRVFASHTREKKIR